jgi:hypothetical protein
MKRGQPLRELRLAHVGVGALTLAVPASAAALAAGPHAYSAQGQQATPQQDPVQAKVRARTVRYGNKVIVTGHAPSSYAAQTLTLQYAPAGEADWRTLATTRVSRNGSFRLGARLQRSGLVRVGGGAATAGSPQAGATTAPLALAASGSSTQATAPQRVTIVADIRAPSRVIDVLGSGTVHARGRLLPAGPHRRVQLQALRAGRWVTVASARTGARGGFDLRYGAGDLGQERLRVRFAGDRANGGAVERAGTVTTYRQTAASWYEDGGSTACGFHAYYGVANVSLPCGSTVKFMYGGRTVTAVVDDRGPYVGGRTWDLNQNTAGALGMGGVQTVWSSS